MREYSRTPAEILMPREKRPLPDHFYDLMTEIKKRNRPKILTIESSRVTPEQAAKDRLLVRERNPHYREEKTEYAEFLEAALPEVNNYDWFGGNVVVINQGHGDAVDYNDIRGTDLMLEMETNQGEKPIALRIDLTKSNDPAKIKNKIDTVLGDARDGRFTPTYFKSYYQETPAEKIDTAPRVIMHLTEKQIDQLGNMLHQANFGTDKKAAIQNLENSSLQINLIDQAQSQLESQALYTLALFLEAVNNQYRQYHLDPDTKNELIDFYDRAKAANNRRDNSEEVLGLIQEFLQNSNLKKFPRYQETTRILTGLDVWLQHFNKLEQEKNGQLPESARQQAAIDASGSESQRTLTTRPDQVALAFPPRLRFAA